MIQVIFLISVFLLFHSYVLYPLILNLLARSKKQNFLIYPSEDELPIISILLAAYNEEKVIQKKIETTFNTQYPGHKIELLIGSDKSTDNTNSIIEQYALKDIRIKFTTFSSRQGKGNILNNISKQAKGQIYVLTDAKVFFTPKTLFELVKHFKNPQIGMVGGNLINKNRESHEIAVQEMTFMSREIKMKYQEGVVWGTMMGAYGACYAIRSKNWRPIPEGFSVEDFYMTMKVLQDKKACITELKAKCFENVPGLLQEEFRRKVRISAGNFQNLIAFRRMLWPPWKGLSFSFLSHKVIRWIGPLLLIVAFISNGVLFSKNIIYKYLFICQIALLLVPFLDYILRKIQVHVVLLRFITHFYGMNAALLTGLFKYLKGVKTNVWEPTARNQ